MTLPKKGLGKGLAALITVEDKGTDWNAAASQPGVIEVDINKIEPNKNQPRKYFDDDSLRELAQSLAEYGVIQPIIVKDEGDYYSIIAGERRWRAARIAKLPKLPVIIKDYAEVDILQIALVENIQRQDLNPIEEALCYKRLIDEYFFTQDDIASKVGKSRNSISYSMSLLNLDPRVQNFIIEGKLTAGHARHLLQIKDGDVQFEFAERVIDEAASVRETEQQVKSFLTAPKTHPAKHSQAASPHFTQAETDLRSILGTKVSIRDGKNKGKIEIEYYSADELNRILGIFKKIDA